MLGPLLNDCRTLLKKLLRSTVQHIFREANQCANALAKFRATQSFDYANFVNPSAVVDLRIFDKAELFCNKLIRS